MVARLIPILVVMAGLCATGACAPASNALAAPDGVSAAPCFQARQARSYSRIGPQTLLVEAGIRGSYQMEMLDTCPDLDWSNDAMFRGRGGGTFVCSALDAEIVLPRDGRRQVCLFNRITPISRAEADAFAGDRRMFQAWRPEQPRWPPIIRRPGLRPPPEPPPPAAP
jgi:hypothetical protein